MNLAEIAARNRMIVERARAERERRRVGFFDSPAGLALKAYGQKVASGGFLQQNLDVLNRMGESPEALNEALGMFGFGGITKPQEGLRRLFNASTRDREHGGYLEPHVSDWVKEIAAGVDMPLEDITTDLIYMSENKADWIKSIVGRKIGKNVGDVTVADIKKHGRLNILDIDPDYDEVYKVGDYFDDQSLTDLMGNRRKFYETLIYDEGDVYSGAGRLTELPVGPEPSDWIAKEAQEITHSLVGDELLKFLGLVE